VPHAFFGVSVEELEELSELDDDSALESFFLEDAEDVPDE
jgi:hypothetical protein